MGPPGTTKIVRAGFGVGIRSDRVKIVPVDRFGRSWVFEVDAEDARWIHGQCDVCDCWAAVAGLGEAAVAAGMVICRYRGVDEIYAWRGESFSSVDDSVWMSGLGRLRREC